MHYGSCDEFRHYINFAKIASQSTATPVGLHDFIPKASFVRRFNWNVSHMCTVCLTVRSRNFLKNCSISGCSFQFHLDRSFFINVQQMWLTLMSNLFLPGSLCTVMEPRAADTDRTGNMWRRREPRCYRNYRDSDLTVAGCESRTTLESGLKLVYGHAEIWSFLLMRLRSLFLYLTMWDTLTSRSHVQRWLVCVTDHFC